MKALRRVPLTVAAVATLLLVGALTGSLVHGPSPELLPAVGAGLGPLGDGHWWFPLTAPLWCSSWVDYVTDSTLLVVLLAMVETRLGVRRALAVLLGTQVVGVSAGLGLVWLISLSGGRWAHQLAASVAVGPSEVVVGAALATSAVLPVLWRRRLRLLMLIALVTMALYSGLIADVMRLAYGLVGFGIGVLFLGPPRAERGAQRRRVASRPEARVLVALVVAASAVGPLVAALAQTRVGPLSVLRFVFASPPADPLTVQQICADPAAAFECVKLQTRLRLSGVGPGVMSVMPILLLLITAEGLRRGRRAAWGACIAFNVVLGGLGIALAANAAAQPAHHRMLLGAGRHLHAWLIVALPALQPLLVAALLLAVGGLFDVRAPAGTYRRWGRLVAATLLADCAFYVGASLLLAGGYDRPPGLGELLADLPLRFLPPVYLGTVEPAFLPVSGPATWLFEWTGVVFWSVVALAALATFSRTRLVSNTAELGLVRRLLARDGGSSLAHMTTWAGNAYWFTSDSGAAVAYRVHAGVALTTGGPIGDPELRAKAMLGFTEHCHQLGWIPCWYSVDAQAAAALAELGFSTLQVAEETVLRLPELAFTGRKWQDIRSALNRAKKAGVTAEWCSYRHAPLAITDQIRVISEEWVAEKGLPEMGFTLGGLDELADDDVRLLIAVDADRTLHAVTSWLPVHRDGQLDGWTLDFMRRRGDAFAGASEFLIASAALLCQQEGAEFLSLSGAPLARIDRGQPIGSAQRLLDRTGQLLEPVYGFRSLMAFKAKFQPEYRPLYLGYPDPTTLPSIGNALSRAYLPHLQPRQASRLARTLLGRRTRPARNVLTPHAAP
jgi:lysylphosphatidylglycerol synthetase-like protein (DUF2156 family)